MKTVYPFNWQGEAPQYDWIVNGYFLRGTVGLVTGDGGVGKSLLLQQLVTAAAAGGFWLDRTVEHCGCTAVWCEDDEAELWRRQDRINQACHFDPDMLVGLQYITRCGEDSILVDFGRYGKEPQTTAFYAQVREHVLRNKSRILVVDTAADTFGGNENIRAHVRAYITIMTRLAIEMQGAVILTAHPSVVGMSSGTGISGSTGWSNSVRCRLYLTRPEGDKTSNRRVLKSKKMNYAKAGGEVDLVWSEGVFQTVTPSPSYHPD